MLKYILWFLTFVLGVVIIHFTAKHYIADLMLYNTITVIGYSVWGGVIWYNISIYFKVKQQQMKQGIKDGCSNNRINRINNDRN